MINNPNDIGFIHDIASLDRLRQQALNGDKEAETQALNAAARQFEAIFTAMMLKSMRDANSHFKSDLFGSQNEDFYRQMQDEQMVSHLSATGSLGLADMIVAQLTASDRVSTTESNHDRLQEAMERVQQARSASLDAKSQEEQKIPSSLATASSPAEYRFDSPQSFVSSLRPYADKAAQVLGIDASLLLAQAALETGWGQKMVSNTRGSSNNLFNIKADRSWQGERVATQTLEYYDNTPVMEKAAFRAYPSFQESFDDYLRFLEHNPRYSNALNHGGNNEAFIRGIHQAGYATDPQYADKVLQVKAQIDQMNES